MSRNTSKLYGVVNADCLDAMKRMSDNAIDAIVTDPPYGLDFMGKNWDHGVPGIEFWKEALRIAKPGAHLLAFGGTRTYHRLACAIEDAGWEIRDTIMWVYSSGFPKSMDISKAIDKKLGAKREKVRGKFGKTSFGLINDDSWTSHPDVDSDIPVSDQAKKWSGWGTCLKPAVEPIVLARKPVEGTVTDNVLKWGVGGINIDECRVESDKPFVIHSPARDTLFHSGHKDLGTWIENRGRFPANLIHDGSDEVLEVFPEGTARFFYCPKASKKEKGNKNSHPTVKPIELMKYLVKLVAPKGALVLDPFMGSGTTGVAALEIGRRFLGVEKEPEYFKIAENRLEGAKPESSEVV